MKPGLSKSLLIKKSLLMRSKHLMLRNNSFKSIKLLRS